MKCSKSRSKREVYVKTGLPQEQEKSLRGHTDGQQAHEKMPNITNHLGNANQNHNEISPHPVRMDTIKKIRNNTHALLVRM